MWCGRRGAGGGMRTRHGRRSGGRHAAQSARRRHGAAARLRLVAQAQQPALEVAPIGQLPHGCAFAPGNLRAHDRHPRPNQQNAHQLGVAGKHRTHSLKIRMLAASAVGLKSPQLGDSRGTRIRRKRLVIQVKKRRIKRGALAARHGSGSAFRARTFRARRGGPSGTSS